MAKALQPMTETLKQQQYHEAFEPPPAWLTDTERALYDELVAVTRSLGKRGVPVCYSAIGKIAEGIRHAHTEGRSAIVVITAGLDDVRAVERKHTEQHAARVKEYWRDERILTLVAWGWVIFLFAIGFTLAAVASFTDGTATDARAWLYFALFCYAVAGLFIGGTRLGQPRE